MKDLLVGVICFYYCFFIYFERFTVKAIVETALTSGTLDAIRERMKSMQLAAAAGNIDYGDLLWHILALYFYKYIHKS